MKELITRKDAISKGLTRYFTGARCKNGHVSERYVLSGECFDCNTEKTRRYRNYAKAAIKKVRDSVNNS